MQAYEVRCCANGTQCPVKLTPEARTAAEKTADEKVAIKKTADEKAVAEKLAARDRRSAAYFFSDYHHIFHPPGLLEGVVSRCSDIVLDP